MKEVAGFEGDGVGEPNMLDDCEVAGENENDEEAFAFSAMGAEELNNDEDVGAGNRCIDEKGLAFSVCSSAAGVSGSGAFAGSASLTGDGNRLEAAVAVANVGFGGRGMAAKGLTFGASSSCSTCGGLSGDSSPESSFVLVGVAGPPFAVGLFHPNGVTAGLKGEASGDVCIIESSLV